VDIGGEPEQLFGEGATGALPAPWIGVRSTYVFPLYRTGDRAKPLAIVVVMPQTAQAPVTHAARTFREAAPNPVPGSSGFSTTTIKWATGNSEPGLVYVSANGGPEELFAEGLGGTYQALWIDRRGSYRFTLYAGHEHKVVLADLVVHREGDEPNSSRPR